MSRLAGKILCIPASSASSERIISSAGLTVSDKRTRLDSNIVSEIVFLRNSWESIDGYNNNNKNSWKRKYPEFTFDFAEEDAI